jgi:RNA polymerase sigma factor (sigma-70 family)
VDKKEAFIMAIQENKALVYKIASVYTNTIEDRNDLSQEIIYQLWKSFDSFAERSSLRTWLYRVAMNVAIYHLKKSKRRVSTIALQEQFLDFHEADDNDAGEKWKQLRQHLDTLNLLDKGIVVLYLENKSYEEIAQVVGISATNVGTRLSRIKEKLRQQILKQP